MTRSLTLLGDLTDRISRGEEVVVGSQSTMERLCLDFARQRPPRYLRANSIRGGGYRVALVAARKLPG